MTTIGVVGLGTMGRGLASRLLDLGHEVHGTNRSEAKAEGLIARGMHWHDSPHAVAGAVEVVISMVTDDAALAAITGGPQGILAGLRKGQIYVDMSTVSPAASIEVAHGVRALGGHMLDAPVSGSVPQVEQGTLAIMVGGDRSAFEAVEPVLGQLGQTVTHVGENGQGLVLKLAINISLAVQVVAFSEGLLLAERSGIDAELAAQVMASSSIGSPMLKARVPLLLDLPPTAWFDTRLMHKDIKLAISAGHRLDVEMRTAEVADNLLAIANQRGYGNRDLAALREVLDMMSPALASAAVDVEDGA